MFGKNPIRPPIKSDGSHLEVEEIFLTIQGEGPLVGTPAVFIRLGGCNLACTFCDTEFENFKEIHIEQILQEILQLQSRTKTKLVVITGGEPMRQPIENFCRLLIAHNFDIQIETNGTLFRDLPEQVSIVCSPKPGKFGYSKIRSDLLERLTAVKFIISKTLPEYSQIPDVGQSQHDTAVYVQPMDEYDQTKNKQNTLHAIELAQKHGYKLSLQTHKFINIR